MRLAFIIDDYLPHSTRVAAKMFHELALYYTEVGHDVTVITPASEPSKKLSIDYLDGIRIWRFPSGKIKDVNKLSRGINESLLSYRAWKAISKMIDSQTFDGVVYYSPSVFFGYLVKCIKKRCACPSYLVLRDLFPQWLIDAGIIKKGSVFDYYFRFFERFSYNQADFIGLMSKRNQMIFDHLTDGRYQTNILPNWANSKSISNVVDSDELFERMGILGKIIFFYGGNIGHAQDMLNLMRLAKSLNVRDNRAHFLFVGQGDEVDLINRYAKRWELSNFTYLPSVNQQTFKGLLAKVDIGLFSLAANHTAHNFPGKILGYMSEAIPILGSVNPGNDLMDIVNDSRAGYISVNGDDEALYQNALLLLESEHLRKEMGSNAMTLLESEFSVESAGQKILTALNSR